MQPSYITISAMFSAPTRHTVPLFQRPYVWTREDQWEPLWEDIMGLLDRLARRVADAPVASHFLGTIVLEQVANPTGSLPRREVIDGQQRLTTLQLLLKAAEHSLASLAATQDNPDDVKRVQLATKQITALTENLGEGVERYKVWPTNEDREPFQLVMDSTADGEIAGPPTRMSNAYAFFRGKIDEYLAAEDGTTGALRLAAALQDYLKVIVLDLDPNDEPQAIFETLNAHGTPLLPADLIKNWLLWEAARQKLEAGPLYEHHWRPFDREHEYWRARIGTGHAARARVDTFLQNWLTKETAELVSSKHLYDRFIRHMGELKQSQTDRLVDVTSLMGGIRADADRFERIDRPSGNSRFDIFLDRMKAMDITVFHPLLMVLMKELETDAQELDRIAVVLESYLVRRMIGNYQTRGYGILALGLQKEVLRDLPTAPSERLAAALLSESGVTAWPTDDEFRQEWLRRRFYGSLRRERVLMILKAIEHRYQTAKHLSEPLMDFDWKQLQIEHVMPQNWHTHWPLPEHVDPAARDYAIHGIGNLTLVSGKLNPTLSNAPWTSTPKLRGKRESLEEQSSLNLNRLLLKHHESWDDAAIAGRAAALFEDAKAIWPRPEQLQL